MSRPHLTNVLGANFDQNGSKTERHRKTAASKTRFYGGPAETRRKVDTSTTAADNAGVDAQAASRDTPPKEDVWKRTPQELREELLLEQSLPAAYGGSGADIGFGGGEAEDSKWRLPGTHSAMTALASSERLTARINSISTPTSSSGKAVEVPATAAASRADTPGARTPSSKVSGAAAVSVGSGYKEASPFGAEKKRRQEAERPGVLAGATNTMKSWVGKADETSVGTAGAGDGGTGNNSLKLSQVLEGENRDLVARFKNELDDARLVESKMSEVGLKLSQQRGLFLGCRISVEETQQSRRFHSNVFAEKNLLRATDVRLRHKITKPSAIWFLAYWMWHPASPFSGQTEAIAGKSFECRKWIPYKYVAKGRPLNHQSTACCFLNAVHTSATLPCYPALNSAGFLSGKHAPIPNPAKCPQGTA